MIRFGLRIFHRNQKGLTLVELLIAIAITAVIGTAVATASYQIFKVNVQSTNHQIAVAQVQNATNAINRDAQQAQNVFPMDNNNNLLPASANQILFDLKKTPNGDQLELYWVAWDVTSQHNTTHVVIYSVVNKVLQKKITLTVDNGLPTTTTSVVANYITSVSGNWNTYTNTLTLTMQANVGVGSNLVSENRTLQIIPRPAQ